ncbi:MAG: 4'-phosphopantetheinyl transferase superfamily protein [Myxococcales bacterium]|nr:4'-phosphopantetheinyl transferase superfamily protein [Myxococcales bacterium]MCB9731639.1 4'-phosphopantetheinyl transferase superfamily protein [Deltaproteobacteria bacterium]
MLEALGRPAPDVAHLSIGGVARMAPTRVGGWLTPSERATYDALAVAKRRRDWLAGRVAAKELVRRRHQLGDDGYQRIRVAPVASGADRGRPRYDLDDRPGAYALSIAHSGDLGVAALAAAPGLRVGVDVEHPIDPSPGFDEVALAPTERVALAALPTALQRDARTRLWVVKEALVKALGTGLRVDLTDIAVPLDARGELAPGPFALRAVAGPLAALDPLAITARTFRIGPAHGAWVVLSPC